VQYSSKNFLSRIFFHWAQFCFDHAKLCIGFTLILVVILSSQVPKLKMDISTEAMLRKDDAVRVNYQNFRQVFGREDAIILSVPTGGSLSNELLEKIFNLQSEIENNVPYVHKITSLINARYSYGENDDLIVEGLLENFPKHKWESDELLQFVLRQPNYVNRLSSEDGKFTAIAIELQTYAPGTNELLNEEQSAES